MKLSQKKREDIASATLVSTLCLMTSGFLLLILSAQAAEPGWWSAAGTGSQSAVMAPQVVTNSGVVTTNYVPNPNGVVLEGQLKQFTVRAVDAMNANLPGGAGTNLENLVSGWANDYATNHYGPGNIKPSDHRIVNNGELKYIGSFIWSQLAAEGFANSPPFWLRQDTNFDGQAALLGQLKSVFNFDFPTTSPVISSGLTVSGVSGQNIRYQVPASNRVLSYSSTNLLSGLSIDPITGVISGESTNTGSYTIDITATNSIGSTTVAVTLNLISSSTTYPDLQNTSVPSSEPTLPSSVDPFSPPVTSSTPPSGAPVIAEWTRIAKPGDVIVLTGGQFSSYTDQRAGEDTQFFAYAQTSAGTVFAMCPIIHADGAKAAVVLPSNFPPNAEVFLWPINSAGPGYPVAINATETWWIGPNTATRGGTVSVYGRNLADPSGSSFVSNIYIQTSDETGAWATVTAANPYKVDFTVPSSMADGIYQVWVHNNRGGHYGWNGPLSLTINDGTPWNGSTYNVKSFGAAGDGSTDDTAAIENTLNAASTNAWSTVYLPTGTYVISNALNARTQVRLKGDGPTNTIIMATNYVSGLEPNMIYASGGPAGPMDPSATHDVTVQDMTVNPNSALVIGTNTLVSAIYARNVNDFKFINDSIGSVGSPTADFSGSNLISFNGCKIIDAYENGIFFGTANQVFVDSCHIYGANDVNTMLTIWGGQGISCTGNTAQDYDDTQTNGWAVGRFFYCSSQWGSDRNMYVGNNTTVGLAVRTATGLDPNQGEQILFENGSQFSGNPASSTSTTVTFSDTLSSALSTNTAYDAAIISGTGIGQHRPVVSWTSTSVTVSPPWTIPPDASSTVIVGGLAEHIAVYQNTLQGKSDYATRVTASAGISAASETWDLVADGNSISQVRRGIEVWGELATGSGANVMSSDFFNNFANNMITNSLNGIYINGFNNDVMNPTFEGIGCFGNLFTSNTVNSIAQSGIEETLENSPPGDQLDMNVFANNIVTNTTNAFNIPISSQINNTILFKNNSSLGSAIYEGSTGLAFGTDATDSLPLLRGNSYTGFQIKYSGAQLPSSALEAPSHVVSVYGKAGGSVIHGSLSIWNTGTGGLSWSATTSSSWLILNQSSGITPPETGASTLDLACDPSSLAAGTYTGTVVVTANGQPRDYTVAFTVAAGP